MTAKRILVTPTLHDVSMTSLTISCDECAMQSTAACDDCVVTFICERDPDEAIVFDAAEERALRMLGGAGLVPRLRHVRRTG